MWGYGPGVAPTAALPHLQVYVPHVEEEPIAVEVLAGLVS